MFSVALRFVKRVVGGGMVLDCRAVRQEWGKGMFNLVCDVKCVV